MIEEISIRPLIKIKLKKNGMEIKIEIIRAMIEVQCQEMENTGKIKTIKAVIDTKVDEGTEFPILKESR
jgi:hypothetical protein